jgi:hypothetical protein
MLVHRDLSCCFFVSVNKKVTDRKKPYHTKKCICGASSLRHINPVALDLIMHHMGRKIDLAWPNKRAVLNVHLFKHARITQAFKNAGVFRINQSAHMNLALQASHRRT